MITEELLKRAKSNDQVALTQIIKFYKPLVTSIARKYFLIGADTEDLIQEGTIGLYNACNNYDFNNTANFKTFATICIKRQILTTLRTYNSNKNIPLNTYFSIDNQGKVVISVKEKDDDELEENGIFISSPLPTPEEKMLFKEKISEINILVDNKLSGFEKQVLKQYMAGLNYTEISKNLNKDKKIIDNALSRIKAKLKFLLS